MTNETTTLDWDSSFFSLGIASISIYNDDSTYLEYHLAKYKSEKLDLVYVFLNNKSKFPLQLLNQYEAKLVDNKRIYKCVITCNSNIVSSNIFSYNGPPSNLYELALQAGVDSRYKTDSRFSNNQFENLYKTWIENSVTGKIADKVFVYKKEEVIIGFITLKIFDDRVTIGLIATDISYRGKGVGSALIQAAQKYTYISKKNILEVATQATNRVACTFYKRNKFILESETQVYHIWLKKKHYYDSI